MNKKFLSILLATLLALAAIGTSSAEEATEPLSIAEQGLFSAGGTVTEPVEGEYDPTTSWMDATRAGNTAHVGHANVLVSDSRGGQRQPHRLPARLRPVPHGLDDHAGWP